jgi:hypothetical protein
MKMTESLKFGMFDTMARKKASLGHSHLAPVEMAPYGDGEEPAPKAKRGTICHSTPESTVEVCVRATKGGEVMSNMDRVCHRLMPTMGRADREHFVALHLNVRGQVIAQERIATGTATGVEIHPREVFKAAVAHGTVSLVLAHNHPSGDPTPSRQDLELTTRLKQAGEMLGINMVDHVIVGNEGCLSLAERGYLDGYGKLGAMEAERKAKKKPGRSRA